MCAGILQDATGHSCIDPSDQRLRSRHMTATNSTVTDAESLRDRDDVPVHD